MATVYEKTIGEWVAEKPSLSRIFEHYGIDYCCGGKRPLAEVCSEKGINAEELVSRLREAPDERVEGEEIDWNTASLTAMTEHIYEVHHRYLYENMPRLSRMVKKVAAVHGENNPKLQTVEQIYHMLYMELETHMQKEERVLFPFCRMLDESADAPQFHCGHISNPIRVMEFEHEAAGTMLAGIREATDNYTAPDWACNTYRAMLDGLAEMEADIHRHIHEENNILFPRAIQKANALQ